ncbi:MAG TPA: hypothetical protein VKM55_19740 [Candidatus Lokiarchaeia archaeon]|nr:hypothetical protein [Candidatus Lokiarchaeia archaeon]
MSTKDEYPVSQCLSEINDTVPDLAELFSIFANVLTEPTKFRQIIELGPRKECQSIFQTVGGYIKIRYRVEISQDQDKIRLLYCTKFRIPRMFGTALATPAILRKAFHNAYTRLKSENK